MRTVEKRWDRLRRSRPWYLGLGLAPLVGTCEVLNYGIPQFCGLAPGTIGIYQVNFQLPANSSPGLGAVTEGTVIVESAGVGALGFTSNIAPLYVQ
jgi:hypothetical protein